MKIGMYCRETLFEHIPEYFLNSKVKLSIKYKNKSIGVRKVVSCISEITLNMIAFSDLRMTVRAGLLVPKPFRPGTPRPKSIFLLGLLGPGLLGPVIKLLYLWHIMKHKCLSSVCFFNIGLNTICTINVKKKESIFPYKRMIFCFYLGHLGPGHFGHF